MIIAKHPGVVCKAWAEFGKVMRQARLDGGRLMTYHNEASGNVMRRDTEREGEREGGGREKVQTDRFRVGMNRV